MRKLSRSAVVARAVAWSMALFLFVSVHAGPLVDPGFLPVHGGWNSVDTHDAQVLRAAHFALAEQVRLTHASLSLLAIQHARQQVAEGLNYSMNLMVQNEGKKHLVVAVVWVRPDGRLELTRWHWV